METKNMKNMVIIKDLPSNLIEEAFVVLKPGIKNKLKKSIKNNNLENKKDDYILKEARMVISNYISDMKKSGKKEESDKLKKKNNRLKKIIFALIIMYFITIKLILKF